MSMITRISTILLVGLLVGLVGACGETPAEVQGQTDNPPPTPNPSSNSITLNWLAPELSEDGSTLNDLAGYKVYYGTESANYTVVLDVGNSTSTVINNLTPGFTYYFSTTAYDQYGNESQYSTEAQKAF